MINIAQQKASKHCAKARYLSYLGLLYVCHNKLLELSQAVIKNSQQYLNQT